MDTLSKEMIKEMKKEMLFLKAYIKKLRMYSVLYNDQFEPLKVEDQLTDYIHYTKSVIDCRRNNHNYENPILKAMERLEIKRNQEEKAHAHAYLILSAIEQLSTKERNLLLDHYIREYNKEIICMRQGDIVLSTFYRRLDRALLHLYVILR